MTLSSVMDTVRTEAVFCSQEMGDVTGTNLGLSIAFDKDNSHKSSFLADCERAVYQD